MAAAVLTAWPLRVLGLVYWDNLNDAVGGVSVTQLTVGRRLFLFSDLVCACY